MVMTSAVWRRFGTIQSFVEYWERAKRAMLAKARSLLDGEVGNVHMGQTLRKIEIEQHNDAACFAGFSFWVTIRSDERTEEDFVYFRTVWPMVKIGSNWYVAGTGLDDQILTEFDDSSR